MYSGLGVRRDEAGLGRTRRDETRRRGAMREQGETEERIPHVADDKGKRCYQQCNEVIQRTKSRGHPYVENPKRPRLAQPRFPKTNEYNANSKART